MLCKGEAVLIASSEPLLQEQTGQLIELKNTRLCYTADGRAFYIPFYLLQTYDDLDRYPWFYPFPISHSQASLFLQEEGQRGCFIVYVALNTDAEYHLAVYVSPDLIVHHRVKQGQHGDFAIENDNRYFLTIAELVRYLQQNRNKLVTRLRRSLRDARQPLTAGIHYDLVYELDRTKLHLTGNIIGRGEFGVIWAATYQQDHAHDPTSVAVKVMQDDNEFSDYALQQLILNEIHLMIQLNHCNVIKLIGVSCSTRPYFIVTENSYDGSLKDCLRKGALGNSNLQVLLDVCIQTAAAVAYLHSFHYILHRDLAARNFVVTSDITHRLDNVFCVKLAEFSRAQRVSRDDVYRAEQDEPVCVKWAAPEVLTDLEYSSRSDIWALAVVWWEVGHY